MPNQDKKRIKESDVKHIKKLKPVVSAGAGDIGGGGTGGNGPGTGGGTRPCAPTQG